jgi:hypothetical protein
MKGIFINGRADTRGCVPATGNWGGDSYPNDVKMVREGMAKQCSDPRITRKTRKERGRIFDGQLKALKRREKGEPQISGQALLFSGSVEIVAVRTFEYRRAEKAADAEACRVGGVGELVLCVFGVGRDRFTLSSGVLAT